MWTAHRSTSNALWHKRALYSAENIVENAINATPPFGLVMINEATIRIYDEDTVVDPEYLPFLFERFWRAPETLNPPVMPTVRFSSKLSLNEARHKRDA